MSCHRPHRDLLTPWVTCVCLVGSFVFGGAATAQTAEWRMPRHDLRNSRYSPGTAALVSPVSRWRARVGGSASQLMGADVTLSGDEEFIALEAGSVSARTWSGQTLWRTPAFGATALVSLRDLTGDKIPELVVRSAVNVKVINLLSGKTLWSPKAGQFSDLAFVAVADVDGDGALELALANQGGYAGKQPGETYVVRMSSDGAVPVCQTSPTGPYGKPVNASVQLLGDIDGDGVMELISTTTSSDGTWWIFSRSAATCNEHAKSAPFTGVGTPACALVGQKWLFCLDPPKATAGPRGLTRYVAVKGTVTAAWTLEPKNLETQSVKAVGDFDGDGDEELLVWRPEVGLQAVDLGDGTALGAASTLGLTKAPQGDIQVKPFALGNATMFAIHEADQGGPLMGMTRIFRWQRGVGFSQVGQMQGWLGPHRVEGALSLSPSLGPQGGNALSYVDGDGDGLIDTVKVMRLEWTNGVVTSVPLGSIPRDPLGTAVQTVREGATDHIVSARRDGRVGVYRADGALLNDADGDGSIDLLYSGRVQGHLYAGLTGSKLPSLLVGAPGRLLRYVPADSGAALSDDEALLLQSGVAPVIGLPLAVSAAQRGIAVVHQPPGEGVQASAMTEQGDVLWSWSAPDKTYSLASYLGPVLAVVAENSREDLVVGMHKLDSPGGAGFRRVHGASGALVWPADAAASQLGVLPRTFAVGLVDGERRMVTSIYTTRLHFDLSDGSLSYQSKGVKEPRYGIPRVTGDKLLVAHGSNGHGLETLNDSSPVWKIDGKQWWKAPSSLVEYEGKRWLVSLTKGDNIVELLDVDSGKLLWSKRYGAGAEGTKDGTSLLSVVTCRDLTGDGVPDALLTSDAGWLYAVSLDNGAVRWSLDYQGDLGEPILADMDDDGALEVALFTPDGYVEVLDQESLEAVSWLREHSAQGPALTSSDDLDTQEEADLVRLNWEPVALATSYAVRIVSDEGSPVSPWVATQAKSQAVLKGLNLQTETKYVAQIRATGTVDGQLTTSKLTQSDGFSVIDLTPPSWESLTMDPALLPADHQGATLFLKAADLTRLAAVRCDLMQGDKVLRSLQAPLNLAKIARSLPWDGLLDAGTKAPAGLYRFVCELTDVGGHASSSSVQFEVCSGLVNGAVCAVASTSNEANALGLSGERLADDGCGCQLTRPQGATPWRAQAGLLALLLGVILRSRRRRRPRQASP